MKKLLFTLTFAAAVFAGNLHAQTATSDAGLTKEQKKEKLQSMTPEERQAAIMNHTANRSDSGAKYKADHSKKAKVRAHKDELINKYGSEEAAKAAVQEHHQDAKDNNKKDQVAAHKDQIMEHADTKQEAKAKLQRKHDKNKE